LFKRRGLPADRKRDELIVRVTAHITATTFVDLLYLPNKQFMAAANRNGIANPAIRKASIIEYRKRISDLVRLGVDEVNVRLVNIFFAGNQISSISGV